MVMDTLTRAKVEKEALEPVGKKVCIIELDEELKAKLAYPVWQSVTQSLK